MTNIHIHYGKGNSRETGVQHDNGRCETDIKYSRRLIKLLKDHVTEKQFKNIVNDK